MATTCFKASKLTCGSITSVTRSNAPRYRSTSAEAAPGDTVTITLSDTVDTACARVSGDDIYRGAVVNGTLTVTGADVVNCSFQSLLQSDLAAALDDAVRSGVVVEDVDMSASRHEPLRIDEDPQGVSPCVTLGRRVCGIRGECESGEACQLARQLLRFEEEERQDRPDIPPQTVLRQCRDALSNPTTFPGCPANVALSEDSPCRSLLRRVCGKANECSDTPACRAARQLGDMEIDERLSAAQPELNPRAAGQCTQALLDRDFFLPCR